MIGAGCSIATEAIAEVSHYYSLNQVMLVYELCVMHDCNTETNGKYYKDALSFLSLI